MKETFIITARLKSTRLPKKILLKVKGEPLIVHMINRIKYSKKINNIIIATSTNTQDDLLEDIAKKQNVHCFRGSEEDVLMRLLEASRKFNLSSFVNMTADIPMIDPLLIDNAINVYQNIKPDLLLFEKYSFGVCLMVKVSALSKVCKEKKNNYTEAWVKFFQNNKNINIHIENVSKENKNKFLKTSLDYYEDFLFIKRVFEELYKENEIFYNKDITNLLIKKPYIKNINSNDFFLKRWESHRLKLN